jgi:hypothetical protein
MEIIWEFDNCIIFKENELYGIMDKEKNIIHQPIYSDINCSFNNHFEIVDKNLNVRLINKKTLKINLFIGATVINEYKEYYYTSTIAYGSITIKLLDKITLKEVFTSCYVDNKKYEYYLNIFLSKQRVEKLRQLEEMI